MAELTFQDLAKALKQFNRYSAIDVFADDVRELVAAKQGIVPAGMRRIAGNHYLVSVAGDGQAYSLTVADTGVARFAKIPPPIPPATNTVTGAILGAAVGAALQGAASRKSGDWMPGLVLGMMAGAALAGSGTAAKAAPTRVFTLRFDPTSREWRFYDGGLMRWMKRNLAEDAG